MIRAIAIATALAAPLEAQTACMPRDGLVKQLAAKHGETRQSMGLGSNNTLIEVFANPDSRSWSIVMTMTNGMACLVAAGVAYEALADPLPPKGKDM